MSYFAQASKIQNMRRRQIYWEDFNSIVWVPNAKYLHFPSVKFWKYVKASFYPS